MPTPVILVTGANGQLGREIRAMASTFPSFSFIFSAREDLPVHQPDPVWQFFEKIKPGYCINCAAYTAVDRAETEKEAAMLVNADAVGTLAAVCKSFGTHFIHVSTDYVFDGTATKPYAETDSTNPVNYYGWTKLKGEQLAEKNNEETVIIRTSWVYSIYGNNFVKTMMRLMKERESLSVVSDQLGSPTSAADLASVILKIIKGSSDGSLSWSAGIYHYSNKGIISWYDFALAIKNLSNSNCVINPIPASDYPTAASRPAYSAFNKHKIINTYQLEENDWEDSLAQVVKQLK